MKTIKITVLTLLIGVFAACGDQTNSNDNNEANEPVISIRKLDIESLEAEIKKRSAAIEKDTVADKTKSAALLEAYVVYSDNFPNYNNAADYTFRAGELAMNLNHTAHSIKLFSKIYKDYPDYEKRPYALFMKAFVLENQAQNYEEAQKFYEEFIAEYPDHDMADDAEYSIKNMGKSPEELIREFERQDSIRAAQAV